MKNRALRRQFDYLLKLYGPSTREVLEEVLEALLAMATLKDEAGVSLELKPKEGGGYLLKIEYADERKNLWL